jgi:hypothetical protein
MEGKEQYWGIGRPGLEILSKIRGEERVVARILQLVHKVSVKAFDLGFHLTDLSA